LVKITIQRGCEIIVIKRGIKPDIKAWLVVFFNNCLRYAHPAEAHLKLRGTEARLKR